MNLSSVNRGEIFDFEAARTLYLILCLLESYTFSEERPPGYVVASTSSEG